MHESTEVNADLYIYILDKIVNLEKINDYDMKKSRLYFNTIQHLT